MEKEEKFLIEKSEEEMTSSIGIPYIKTISTMHDFLNTFVEWLINFKGLTRTEIDSYMSILNIIKTGVISIPFASEEELINLQAALLEFRSFKQVDANYHNSYHRASINCLFMAMDLKKIKSKENDAIKAASADRKEDIKKSNIVYSNNRKTLKTTKEYMQNSKTAHAPALQPIVKVLNNHFKNGIRLNSIISIKKFMKYFKDTYPKIELSDDTEYLKKIIKKVTVQCSDDLYFTQNIIGSNDVIRYIIRFIIDTFKSGKKIICISCIYNHFKERLLDTNIHNEEILESLIKYYLKDDCKYQKGYIHRERGRLEDIIDDEVLEVLSASDVPLSKHDIFKALYYLSQSTIEQTLNKNVCSVYVQKNLYWNIDKYDVSIFDLYLLEDIIKFEIQNGFISMKKLLDVLRSRAPEFLEKNSIYNHVCLRHILSVYLPDFKFQNNFVGKHDDEMSSIVATSKFVSDKESFTLSELIEFVNENDLPTMLHLFIDEISKDFIRINKQDFIKKSFFNINTDDIERIEDVIYKYLTNGYAAISEIDSFSIFPTINYQWNSFLLESIINNYCEVFEFIDYSCSVTKTIGFIVDKRAGIKSYDEILVDVISDYDKHYQFKNSKAALKFLYEKGYLVQERYKNFVRLYEMAKKKNLKSGLITNV